MVDVSAAGPATDGRPRPGGGGGEGSGLRSWDPTRGDDMDDREIVQRIHQLVEDEHKLNAAHEGEVATDEDRRRMRELEVALDQCWDLLRQRRARREAGLAPDDAAVRPEGVVEGYQQ
jgi:hypothetical protein